MHGRSAASTPEHGSTPFCNIGYASVELFSITNFHHSVEMASELQEDNCYVALTHDHLDAKAMMDRVRSPKAGAIVLFAGGIIEASAQKIPLTRSRYNSR